MVPAELESATHGSVDIAVHRGVRLSVRNELSRAVCPRELVWLHRRNSLVTNQRVARKTHELQLCMKA